jgi:hypothetical protein
MKYGCSKDIVGFWKNKKSREKADKLKHLLLTNYVTNLRTMFA